MSAPEKRVELSPDARIDFTEILMDSDQRWGPEQRDRYEAKLTRAIELLGSFPEMGVRRNNLLRGSRALPVGQHVVYYRVRGDVVEIVRILHERMDAARHLRP